MEDLVKWTENCSQEGRIRGRQVRGEGGAREMEGNISRRGEQSPGQMLLTGGVDEN